MSFLTRAELLNHVHEPLVNPQGDPPSDSSPTKSPVRYRWRELRDWDIEPEASEYWSNLPSEDKDTPIPGLHPTHWDSVGLQLSSYTEPFIVESTLRDPFGAAYRSPHNVAILGASDHHAEIRSKAVGLDGDPAIGNADLVFVYNRKLTAIIELKTWWKVNQKEIDDVRHGTSPFAGYTIYFKLIQRPRTIERRPSRTSCS